MLALEQSGGVVRPLQPTSATGLHTARVTGIPAGRVGSGRAVAVRVGSSSGGTGRVE